MTRFGALLALATAALLASASIAGAALPHRRTIDSGWQVRDQKNDPSKPQQAPPDESGGEAPSAPPTGPTMDPNQNFTFHRTAVPNVFDPIVRASVYPGEVRRYRLRFRGPATPRGFS